MITLESNAKYTSLDDVVNIIKTELNALGYKYHITKDMGPFPFVISDNNYLIITFDSDFEDDWGNGIKSYKVHPNIIIQPIHKNLDYETLFQLKNEIETGMALLKSLDQISLKYTEI